MNRTYPSFPDSCATAVFAMIFGYQKSEIGDAGVERRKVMAGWLGVMSFAGICITLAFLARVLMKRVRPDRLWYEKDRPTF